MTALFYSGFYSQKSSTSSCLHTCVQTAHFQQMRPLKLEVLNKSDVQCNAVLICHSCEMVGAYEVQPDEELDE